MNIQAMTAGSLLLLLAGCATDPAPTQQLRLADQTVEQARAVGATDDNQAMKLAIDKLAQARAQMANGNFKGARLNTEQAELDARLAEDQLLTAKGQEQIKALDARIQRLRKQLGDMQ
ncbi:DUF4398 domain-containing protein [Pseudomonas rhizosphaerae]|uniref:DUF4398 domain-containing protein n=1 Tax=Pseudomonas rhizosphaerae TaxID=216142 RepID=UPI0017805592|nr:DUF4398 domain-containing protein [Pseudomonas rhizosphaerae]MBD8613722.1 DUF4398 domain-containing protein [Pseudomonas putida]MEB2870450.1 DUF4398 domain-containing protein [Pseudomonas rhizosphaerae]